MANWAESQLLTVEPVSAVMSASAWPIAACDRKREACVAVRGLSPEVWPRGKMTPTEFMAAPAIAAVATAAVPASGSADDTFALDEFPVIELVPLPLFPYR